MSPQARGRGRRRRDTETPLHRPKAVFAHVVDEYAALGDRGTVDQLRRCLHPRLIVANGATATPFRTREDS